MEIEKIKKNAIKNQVKIFPEKKYQLRLRRRKEKNEIGDLERFN